MKAEVKSVEFTSDHGILKDNNADWTDSGTAYTSPEWKKSPAVNNPISHTKNSSVTLKVKLSVCPPGLTFDLKGDGGESYLTFVKNGNTSTGGDQEFTITANAALPDKVAKLEKSIAWTVTANGNTCNAGPSGTHKIYVTYGTPAGSVVTERRVADVCEAAKDKSTMDECAGAIATHLKSFKYDINGPKWGPPNLVPPETIWMLHAGSSYSSKCPGLADFIHKHFQMPGLGTGEIRCCHATANGGYAAPTSEPDVTRSCSPNNNGHPPVTPRHDVLDTLEYLAHWDSLNSNTRAPNKYEAACYFNEKYYAVGVGTGVFDFPKDVVTTAFPSISWQYVVGTGLEPRWGLGPCEFNLWSESP